MNNKLSQNKPQCFKDCIVSYSFLCRKSQEFTQCIMKTRNILFPVKKWVPFVSFHFGKSISQLLNIEQQTNTVRNK